MIKDCVTNFERQAMIMMRLSYQQVKEMKGITRWLAKLALGDEKINAIRVMRNETTAVMRHRQSSPSLAAVPIYGV